MPHSAYRLCLTIVLPGILLAATACNQLTLPRFGYDEDAPPPTRIPVSATLLFDEDLQNATLRADACGMPWEGYLGHALAKNFLEMSRDRFAQVSMGEPTDATSETTPGQKELSIRISLLRSALEGSNSTSGEDSYSARLNVQLMAVVFDAEGEPIGKAPLSYSERVNVWTPILMGAGGSCPTGQLDGLVDEAAAELAGQMVAAMGAWYGQTQAQAAPARPGTHGSATPAASGQTGVLAVSSTLLDGNDNLIFEGGEKVGVRIDVTNTGQEPIQSATVSLSGTSTVIDAFASAAAGALEIGPMQPGETKSTIFWGKLPKEVTAQRGELAVSVSALGSTSTQTLVAALRPTGAEGAAPATTVASGPAGSPNAATGSAIVRPKTERHAVLINLSTYRTPWSGADASRSDKFPHLVQVLRTEGGLSRNQMLVLADRSATRADLEEGLLRWLPAKVTSNSIVLVYISTRAVTDEKTGAIYLIPYDGSPKAPQRSLVSLEALQGTLKRINAKLCLLLIDAPVTATTGAKTRSDWQGLINPAANSSGRLVQIVSSHGSRRLDRFLVLALSGQADANQDKQVTLGELLDYLKVSAHVYPTLSPTAPERAIPITG